MHHRRSDWRGWLVCAVVSLLLVLPAAALAAEGGGGHGGGGLINLDKSLIVQLINFIILLIILQRFLYKPLLAKIRHNHEPADATLRMLADGRAEVVFDQPQRAIAPGQSCVWYQGEDVLGGGVIERR